jgi:hypothetical protein
VVAGHLRVGEIDCKVRDSKESLGKHASLYDCQAGTRHSSSWSQTTHKREAAADGLGGHHYTCSRDARRGAKTSFSPASFAFLPSSNRYVGFSLQVEMLQETDVMVAGEDLSALTTTCEPHEKEYAGIAAELHEAKQELQALQEALSAYNVYKQHRH